MAKALGKPSVDDKDRWGAMLQCIEAGAVSAFVEAYGSQTAEPG